MQFILSSLLLLLLFPVFAWQGYGYVSIPLSTAYQLLNYVFLFRFLKDLSKSDSPFAAYWARASLLFFFLSTFGPWTLSLLMARGMGGTPSYFAAVYYFLHFQYSGGFTFGLFALLFRIMEKENALPVPVTAILRWAFQLLLAGCIPSFFLSLFAWEIPLWVRALGALGGVLNLLAAILIAAGLWRFRASLRKLFLSDAMRVLAILSLLSFVLKSGVHALLIIPSFGWALESREAVIVWLHLVLVGFVSFGLLALLNRKGEMFASAAGLTGIALLWMLGFMASESLLLFGLAGTAHPALLLSASAIMAAAAAAGFVLSLKNKHIQNNGI